MDLQPEIVAVLLAFADEVVPEGGDEVWLTGSRVRGNARPDSDWDLLVISKFGDPEPLGLFESNQLSKQRFEGGYIELVIAHPNHWNVQHRYIIECKNSGIRLR